MSQNRIKAIAIGGAAAGVASSVPILDLLNLFCCALIVGGAVLAVYLAFRDEEAVENPYGAGAGIGALSGVVAAVVGTIVAIPITLIFGNVAAETLQELLENDAIQLEGAPRQMIESLAGSGDSIGAIALLTGLVFGLIVNSIFGTLGGVLGAAFFRKK